MRSVQETATFGSMKRTLLVCLGVLGLTACRADIVPAPEYRTTLNELLLEDARRCDSGFEYPQALIDGIGTQLVEELRCLDDSWLIFYEPCRESGCVWPDGPQPHAMRPEVYEALQEAALSLDDFISITAGYRDIGMQYYSRWYNENCDSSFDAAIPGESNHQGGRAIDVRYWDFWWDALIEHGFEHPIVTDNPHFELRGTAAFRAESEELKSLSILAFQRLWNRNNPDDLIDEDGVYGASTKARLGMSPVEGFAIGACPPGSGGVDPPADPDPDVGIDAPDVGAPDTESDTADVEGDSGPEPDAAPDARHDAGMEDTDADADAGVDTVEPDTRPDALLRDSANEIGTNEDAAPQPLPVYSLVRDGTTPTARGCATSTDPKASWMWIVALVLGRRRPSRRL